MSTQDDHTLKTEDRTQYWPATFNENEDEVRK